MQRALCLSEKRGRKEQLQGTEQLITVSILDNSSFDRSGLPNAAARTRMPAPNSHTHLLDEGGVMKVRLIVPAVALLLAGAVVSLADNPQMGTWKLNEAKSKFSKGATKNNTVVYEAAGDQIKVTVDGVDGDGNAVHSEWTGKFDGKFYAVSGDPTSDMRSYRRINSRTLALTGKKAGKVTVTGRIVVSANGRTRTVTTSGRDSKGRRINTIAVYDKG